MQTRIPLLYSSSVQNSDPSALVPVCRAIELSSVEVGLGFKVGWSGVEYNSIRPNRMRSSKSIVAASSEYAARLDAGHPAAARVLAEGAHAAHWREAAVGPILAKGNSGKINTMSANAKDLIHIGKGGGGSGSRHLRGAGTTREANHES